MSLAVTLPKNISIELLKRMLKVRLTEETIACRYGEGKMRCPTHLCTGQEAVSAAVGVALRSDDYAVSTHRAHGHYIGKGGSLERMISEIYGKSTGCSAGKGGSMHLIDKSKGFLGSTAIVGGTIPIGVGLALSIVLKGTDQVSCVFFGDGATEEGVFYESLSFAALKKLPVLFMCENNLYSVYSHLDVRQPQGRKIHELARSIGVKSYVGDGNDVQQVYTMVDAAVKEMRSGDGPRFFEFSTYRWREHCGHLFDNTLGYRTEEEYLYWKKKDPIELWKNAVLSDKVVSIQEINKIEEDINKEISDAFIHAEAAPFPAKKEAFTDLYCESSAA